MGSSQSKIKPKVTLSRARKAPLTNAAAKSLRPKSAFISYSVLDRIHAFHIKRLLEDNGVKAWLDVFDIRTTGKIESDLFGIVQKHDLFCLLLSPTAVESKWVKQEIQTAKSVPGLRILPIILRPCDVPPDLESTIGFDAREGLERESVRDRLLKVILGPQVVDGSVLFDKVERELQRDKFLQAQAEEAMPHVRQKVGNLSNQPIRNISIVFDPETFPQDPDVILELKLKTKRLWAVGSISFFIARYREGRTWPAEYGFVEPSHKEFYLRLGARLDAQCLWAGRVVKLGRAIHGTTWRKYKESFTMEMDGKEFRSSGTLGLPERFEIPNLETLHYNKSYFELIAHNTLTKVDKKISGDTDVSVDLDAWFPGPPGEINRNRLRIYQSRTTREQRILLSTPYLSSQELTPILRDALLYYYCSRPRSEIDDRDFGSDKLEESITAAVEKKEYGSEDEQRLAAYFLFDKNSTSFKRELWNDAYHGFMQTAELLLPLVQSGSVPVIRDAVSLFLSVRTIVTIGQRSERRSEIVGELAGALMKVARMLKDSDPEEPEYQRMWDETLLLNADINAELGEKELALQCLRERAKVCHHLYLNLTSNDRKFDWLGAMAENIRTVAKWNLPADAEVLEWKSKLRSEIQDDDKFEEVEYFLRSPDELPVWLKGCTVDGWPTKPVKSVALRYSVRIPERWRGDYEVRGSTIQTQHIYRGSHDRDCEWLIIEFMENANEASDMTDWVNMLQTMFGTPVLYDLNYLPQKLPNSWTYVGRIPLFAARLNADEAHGYTGAAVFKPESSPELGRIYVVLARKGTLAWKITLTFMSTCLPNAPGKLVRSNDHTRAGAIFGSLKLDAA